MPDHVQNQLSENYDEIMDQLASMLTGDSKNEKKQE